MLETEDIMRMIDEQMNSGVSRLKVRVSDELNNDEIQKEHHHGRCDIGSPWAKGTVRNCDEIDLK